LKLRVSFENLSSIQYAIFLLTEYIFLFGAHMVAFIDSVSSYRFKADIARRRRSDKWRCAAPLVPLATTKSIARSR